MGRDAVLELCLFNVHKQWPVTLLKQLIQYVVSTLSEHFPLKIEWTTMWLLNCIGILDVSELISKSKVVWSFFVYGSIIIFQKFISMFDVHLNKRIGMFVDLRRRCE